MKDSDKPTLDDVHRSEPDPFRDRQNLEPGPAEAPNADARPDEIDEGDSADLQDEQLDDLDEGSATRARSESDIEEYARTDTGRQRQDDEAPRNSDDDDPWGDGIHDTPLVKRYEDMADRDELARRVEELVADAYDWVGTVQDQDAQDIYDTLVGVAERLGNPSEATTRTEPGEPPPDRDETDA